MDVQSEQQNELASRTKDQPNKVSAGSVSCITTRVNVYFHYCRNFNGFGGRGQLCGQIHWA